MSDIEAILKERGSRYGEFDEHARITQGIKDLMVSGRSWANCSPAQREALDMIAHKIGRIVNGDPNYLDSWTDITGYNELAIKTLEPKAASASVASKWSLTAVAGRAYYMLNDISMAYTGHMLHSNDGYAWYLSESDAKAYACSATVPTGLQAAYEKAKEFARGTPT